MERISVWRFEDPAMGPRKIPTCENVEKGKTRLTESVVFHVDIEKKTVAVEEEKGSRVDVGTKLVYIVSE